MTLDDFESQINATILRRGQDYVDHRAVTSLEQTDAGERTAQVQGSEPYEVQVWLEGREVADWDCDCPYDYGDVCKHVVAVLYALREEVSKHKQTTKHFGTFYPGAAGSFEELLLQLDIEELRAFIRHQRAKNRDFADQFKLFFSHKFPGADIAEAYRKLLHRLIGQHSDRGFMDYQQTRAFAKAVEPSLEDLFAAIDRGALPEAMVLAQVASQEVMKVMEACDDSAGRVGGIVETSIEALKRVAAHPAASPMLLSDLMDWLEQQLPQRAWHSYGDFGYSLLRVARTVAMRAEGGRYLSLLDTLLSSSMTRGAFSDYFREGIIREKVNFLRERGRVQEADRLIEANLDIVKLRAARMEAAIEQGDLEAAKQHIAKGIALAEQKEHPGTVSKWEEQLLRIAELENDLDTIRRLAKKHAFSRGLDQAYYQRWKGTFAPEAWPDVLEAHIASVQAAVAEHAGKQLWGKPQDLLFQHLAPIYIEEELWERLLQLIPAEASMHILRTVHPHLASRYPEALLAHYLPLLQRTADQASNRSAYQELAALMIQVKQDIVGSAAAIDNLTQTLLHTYVRRPAMKEELQRVLKVRAKL
ncbi:MAG: hypothetical protein OHK0039_08150 [Bacteroidia bacterium]